MSTPVAPPLSKEAKHLIYNIYQFFKKRKRDPGSWEYETDANLAKLVAEVSGVSPYSVNRVLREGRAALENTGELVFNGAQFTKHYQKKIEVTDELKTKVANEINEFSAKHHRMPTVPELNKLLVEHDILKSEKSFVRNLLHKMGYTFEAVGKCKKKVLVPPIKQEDHD